MDFDKSFMNKSNIWILKEKILDKISSYRKEVCFSFGKLFSFWLKAGAFYKDTQKVSIHRCNPNKDYIIVFIILDKIWEGVKVIINFKMTFASKYNIVMQHFFYF